MYYRRILQSLIKANRHPKPLIGQLENHILNNLSMEYSLETIIDIADCFVKLESGSEKFYMMLIHTMARGHMYHHANPVIKKYFPLGNDYVLKALRFAEYADKNFEKFE